jgi:hypothetical protein
MKEDYLTAMPEYDESMLLPKAQQQLFQEKVGTLL